MRIGSGSRAVFACLALIASILAVGTSGASAAAVAGSRGAGPRPSSVGRSGGYLDHSWSTVGTTGSIDFDRFECSFTVPELPQDPQAGIADAVFPWCAVVEDHGVTHTGDTSFGIFQPVLMFGDNCTSGQPGNPYGPTGDPTYWQHPYWYYSAQYVYPHPVGSVNYICDTGQAFTAAPGTTLISVFTRDRVHDTITVEMHQPGGAGSTSLTVAHPWNDPTQGWTQFDHHFELQFAVEAWFLFQPLGWPASPTSWPIDMTYEGADAGSFSMSPWDNGPPNATCENPTIGVTTASQRCVYALGDPVVPAAGCTPDDPIAYLGNDTIRGVEAFERSSRRVTLPFAMSGSPVALLLSPDHELLYVIDESGVVDVVDTATESTLRTIIVGSGATSAALSSDGRTLVVTDGADANLVAVDTTSGSVRDVVAVGGNPVGVAISPDGASAYVVDSNGGVVDVVDLATRSVTAMVAVGSAPQGVAVSPDGSRVYVTVTASGSVAVVDVASATQIATIPVGTVPWSVLALPNGRVYVANAMSNSVEVIDASTNAVVASIDLGSGQFALLASSDGSKLHVTVPSTGTMVVVDTATNAVESTTYVGYPARTLALCDVSATPTPTTVPEHPDVVPTFTG